MFRKALAGLVVALCTATAAAPAVADGPEKMVGPIWNPHTKSYFGLVDSLSNSRTWDEAARAASSRWFKRTQGRLAVIPDRDTHDFVMTTFARALNDDTWFGLRYFCSIRKLMWVDGRILETSPAGVWHPQWFRTAKSSCEGVRSMGYMPVYYRDMGGVASWQASGEIKRFYDYLIEFPTGKP